MQKNNVVVVEAKQDNKDFLHTLLSTCPTTHLLVMNDRFEETIEQVDWHEVDVLLLSIDEFESHMTTFVQEITKEYFIPIIIVAQNKVSEATRIVQAIANGATDYYVIHENLTEEDMLKQSRVLAEKLNNFYTKRTTSGLPKKEGHYSRVKNRRPLEVKQTKPSTHTIIAIGTSTGGPKALEKVIRALPKNFSTPLVIVQHMPAKFTASLAKRLNGIGTIAVKEAEDGEVIENSTAYIAPGNYHLEIEKKRKNYTIHLQQQAPRAGHRPSVDVMLESMAQLDALHKIIVILTGMGKDGAQGIERVKEQDPHALVIAEAKETTVVDGMPRAAIDTNHVTKIVKVDQIGKTLVDQLY